MAKPSDRTKKVLPWPRHECYDAPMPCPVVSCRFNTYLEVDPRNGEIYFNHWLIGDNGQEIRPLEPEELTVPNCALHIADRSVDLPFKYMQDGNLSYQWIGEVQFGVSKQCIQQVEERALAKVKKVLLSIRNNKDLADDIRQMFKVTT